MNINDATLQFLRQHRHDDVRQLAFLAQKYPEVDMPWALDQIRGRQMAETKLPTWAARDGIIYPPHLSMEQCSSEATARYKQQVVARWLKSRGFIGGKTVLTDLTGGFGVDFSFLASLFSDALYVERLEHLCDVATHNFECLGLQHASVRNGDATELLDTLPPSTVIFIDPARRDQHGRKTYSIKDCTPDVAQLAPRLLEKCAVLIVKLSPMLDWHEAVREMPAVREVHIVSVGNECKELLLVCSTRSSEPLTVYCQNDQQAFQYRPTPQNAPHLTPNSKFLTPNAQLLTPNASILKAGCYGEVCEAFSLTALSANSHLFFPTENTDEAALFERFPGRIFEITAISTMNKKELRHALAGIDRANIAVRNFPLSAEELRKRLRLKDGGDRYLFGTTAARGEHLIIITKKLR